MKTITVVLTDGPYISEYAEIACRIARAALKKYNVNIFLYLDAVHIPKEGQNPAFFPNMGELFLELAKDGARIEACPRCANARGYHAAEGVCEDFLPGIKVTSLYNLAQMLRETDRVVALSR